MTTTFLFDLAVAVAAALLFSLLFYKLRLPMIVGQLVAGMVVGPFGLGLIRDTTAIDFLSTLGIILLLFVIGLELDPRHLKTVGSKAIVLTTVEFLVAFAVGVLSGLAAGWNLGTSLFLGSVLGLSSTAIVAKIVADRSHEHGESLAATIMMVMVVEDLIAVFLLFLTPELASGNPSSSLGILDCSWEGRLPFSCYLWFQQVPRSENHQPSKPVRDRSWRNLISPSSLLRVPLRGLIRLLGLLARHRRPAGGILSAGQAFSLR